jgi:hypothetical protein
MLPNSQLYQANQLTKSGHSWFSSVTSAFITCSSRNSEQQYAQTRFCCQMSKQILSIRWGLQFRFSKHVWATRAKLKQSFQIPSVPVDESCSLNSIDPRGMDFRSWLVLFSCLGKPGSSEWRCIAIFKGTQRCFELNQMESILRLYSESWNCNKLQSKDAIPDSTESLERIDIHVFSNTGMDLHFNI